MPSEPHVAGERAGRKAPVAGAARLGTWGATIRAARPVVAGDVARRTAASRRAAALRGPSVARRGVSCVRTAIDARRTPARDHGNGEESRPHPYPVNVTFAFVMTSRFRSLTRAL